MSPEEFIKKHITDVLTGEGFPVEVVRGGGQSMVLIITGAALRPAEREACSLTAFSVPDSGLSVRQQRWNASRQRKSRTREEISHPACSDFTTVHTYSNLPSGVNS